MLMRVGTTYIKVARSLSMLEIEQLSIRIFLITSCH